MPRKSTVYEVLIASPGDVIAERGVVVEVIDDWNASHAKSFGINLQPRRWELDTVPELGERPQAIINKQIVDDADMLVAVFSARLGSPTGVAVSGTVEEIERCRQGGKAVFVYFSTAAVPREHDSEQLKQLNEYKRELASRRLYFEFGNTNDLRRLVGRHLAKHMSERHVLVKESPEVKNLAKVSLEIGPAGRSGDVRTVMVTAGKWWGNGAGNGGEMVGNGGKWWKWWTA